MKPAQSPSSHTQDKVLEDVIVFYHVVAITLRGKDSKSDSLQNINEIITFCEIICN
jgi:hypothetical protein